MAWLPQTFLDEPAAERLATEMQTTLGQLLAGEGGAEVVEVSAVDAQHLLAEVGLALAVGGLAAQASAAAFVTVPLPCRLSCPADPVSLTVSGV